MAMAGLEPEPIVWSEPEPKINNFSSATMLYINKYGNNYSMGKIACMLEYLISTFRIIKGSNGKINIVIIIGLNIFFIHSVHPPPPPSTQRKKTILNMTRIMTQTSNFFPSPFTGESAAVEQTSAGVV